MADKFIITEMKLRNTKTGEEYPWDISQSVTIEEMHNTLEPYKPTLEDLVKTCPPLYPPNNTLRRQHKAPISKELRNKRADERYDWWHKNKCEIFDAVWDKFNEYLAGDIKNDVWGNVDTIDDIIKGDTMEYEHTKF